MQNDSSFQLKQQHLIVADGWNTDTILYKAVTFDYSYDLNNWLFGL